MSVGAFLSLSDSIDTNFLLTLFWDFSNLSLYSISGCHCFDWIITIEEIDCFASFSENLVIDILILGGVGRSKPDTEAVSWDLGVLDDLLFEIVDVDIDAMATGRRFVIVFVFFPVVVELQNFVFLMRALLHGIGDLGPEGRNDCLFRNAKLVDEIIDFGAAEVKVVLALPLRRLWAFHFDIEVHVRIFHYFQYLI